MGSSDAQFALANTYLYGDGTPVDKQQAIKWFRAAAANGNKQAAKQLADLHVSLTSEDTPNALSSDSPESGNTFGTKAKPDEQNWDTAILDGKSIGDSQVRSLEFVAYVNHLEQHIKSGWHWMKDGNRYQVVVNINLAPSGVVQEASIERSSGNSQFDASALRAVYKASPVPHPPESLYNQFRQTKITFNSRDESDTQIASATEHEPLPIDTRETSFHPSVTQATTTNVVEDKRNDENTGNEEREDPLSQESPTTEQTIGNTRLTLLNMGLSTTSAANLADKYFVNSSSPCGKRIRQALDGNETAIEELTSMKASCPCATDSPQTNKIESDPPETSTITQNDSDYADKIAKVWLHTFITAQEAQFIDTMKYISCENVSCYSIDGMSKAPDDVIQHLHISCHGNEKLFEASVSHTYGSKVYTFNSENSKIELHDKSEAIGKVSTTQLQENSDSTTPQEQAPPSVVTDSQTNQPTAKPSNDDSISSYLASLHFAWGTVASYLAGLLLGILAICFLPRIYKQVRRSTTSPVALNQKQDVTKTTYVVKSKLKFFLDTTKKHALQLLIVIHRVLLQIKQFLQSDMVKNGASTCKSTLSTLWTKVPKDKATGSKEFRNVKYISGIPGISSKKRVHICAVEQGITLHDPWSRKLLAEIQWTKIVSINAAHNTDSTNQAIRTGFISGSVARGSSPFGVGVGAGLCEVLFDQHRIVINIRPNPTDEYMHEIIFDDLRYDEIRSEFMNARLRFFPDGIPRVITTQKRNESDANSDPLKQLEKLAELKDKGIINEAEFDSMKAELLGRL